MTHFYLPSPDYLLRGRYRYRYSSAYTDVDWNIQWPITKLVINMEHPA